MKSFKILTFAATYFLLTLNAYGDTSPTTDSLSSSSSLINSGAPVSLVWTGSASSYSLYLYCNNGITIKNQSSGSTNTIACNQGTTINSTAIDLIVQNISGTTQSITATVVPRDTNGVENNSASKTVYFSVNTISSPIDSFVITPNYIHSYTPITVSWKGSVNINMKLSCNNSITASSSGYATIPCNSYIFSSDQQSEGTFTFSALNSNQSTTTITATVFPAIGNGAYDGTHSKTEAISIGPTEVVKTSITDFSVSATNTSTTSSLITINWKTDGSPGVNFRARCPEGVTIFNDGATSTIPCNNSYFSLNAYDPSGTLKIKVISLNSLQKTIEIDIVPLVSPLTYNATLLKTASIDILKKSSDPSSSLITVKSLLQSNPASEKSSSAIISTYNFQTLLKLGSRGTAVSELQKLLAQDKDIYPEGIISGYFGALSEKAVKKFQVKYGIAKPGEAGYGTVGPKTRAKLNSFGK